MMTLPQDEAKYIGILKDEHEFAVAYFLYSAAIVRCRYDEMQIVGFSVAMYTTGFHTSDPCFFRTDEVEKHLKSRELI